MDRPRASRTVTAPRGGEVAAPWGRGSEAPAIEATLGRAVRYRGFVLIPQSDLTWLIRPERSPMTVLPFRAPASSLSDVQALVDWRLAQGNAA